MPYLKTDFLVDLKKFQIQGFKNVMEDYVFEKESKDRLLRISVSHADYFPHSFFFNGVFCEIFFREFEEEFSQHYKIRGVSNIPGIGTVSKVLNNVENIDYKLVSKEIKDQVSFLSVAAEVKKVIDYGAMPFFEQFSSLEKVSIFFENIKPQEVVTYIQGPALFTKVILLLKVTNNPNFERQRDEYYKILKNYGAGKESYEVHIKVFEDLFIR